MNIEQRIPHYCIFAFLLSIILFMLEVNVAKAKLIDDPSATAWIYFWPYIFPIFIAYASVITIVLAVILEIILWIRNK